MASILLWVRQDVKFLANHLLARVPELENLILAVDPFPSWHSTQSNLAPIKRAIQWIRSGGVLAIFPAGEVAHYQLSKGDVTDPVWQTSIGQLIHTLQAPILPVFFSGRNSLTFQMAGLLHPRVRTALLVHEFLNKRGGMVSARIGRPIPFNRLKEMPSSEELMEYLRQRNYLLAAQKDHLVSRLNRHYPLHRCGPHGASPQSCPEGWAEGSFRRPFEPENQRAR